MAIFGSKYNDNDSFQGTDTFPFVGWFSKLHGTADADAIYALEGIDVAYGYGGNDTLNGGAGADYLYGGEGHDFIHGGTGNDSMYGETGNDTYRVMDSGDQVFENPGAGIDTVLAHIDYTLPANVENLELEEFSAFSDYGDIHVTFAAPTRGVGNNLNNQITGNSQNNTLYGLDGSDSIYGKGGNDYILGGAGADFLRGDDGIDWLEGGDGSDSIYGGAGDDRLLGGSGYDILYGGDGSDWLEGADERDSIYGEAGNDLLLGGNGDDWLDGGAGVDFMGGGFGNDGYVVDNPGDYVVEVEDGGIDTVTSSVTYTLTDNVENLRLAAKYNNLTGDYDNINGTGNNLNNDISGDRGDNHLVGNAGNDTLSGYNWGINELDTLTGGTGSDRFVLGDSEGCHYTGSSYAVITDFDPYTPISIGQFSFDWEYDTIQVTGSINDYRLGLENWVGGAALDTLIYKGSDIIGIVQDTTNVNLMRDFTPVPYSPLG